MIAQSVDIWVAQETKWMPPDIVFYANEAKRNGWRLLATPCIKTAAGGRSGGLAAFYRPRVNMWNATCEVVRLRVPMEVVTGRVQAMVVH